MSQQTNRAIVAEHFHESARAERVPTAANHVGGIEGDAQCEQHAENRNADLTNGQILEEPAFLDDDGPSAEIPAFITTTNARELFGLRLGETVPEAIARHNAAISAQSLEK